MNFLNKFIKNQYISKAINAYKNNLLYLYTCLNYDFSKERHF